MVGIGQTRFVGDKHRAAAVARACDNGVDLVDAAQNLGECHGERPCLVHQELAVIAVGINPHRVADDGLGRRQKQSGLTIIPKPGAAGPQILVSIIGRKILGERLVAVLAVRRHQAGVTIEVHTPAEHLSAGDRRDGGALVGPEPEIVSGPDQARSVEGHMRARNHKPGVAHHRAAALVIVSGVENNAGVFIGLLLRHRYIQGDRIIFRPQQRRRQSEKHSN